MSQTRNLEIRFSPPRWLYYAIFGVSGFSGLIYESIWSHYLKLFLGHAALAQCLVLIIFMGGMALGAWAASRISERLKSPILVYAIVEAVIGMMAFLFHDAFTGVIELFYTSVLPSLGNPVLGSILKWLAAALLISPQSFLLGTTFPLMTAGIIRRYPDTPGESISTLYFTNSIGAAIGVLVSGFVFFRLWGLPGTILTAGLLNCVLALLVWILLKIDVESLNKPLISTFQTSEKRASASLFLLVAAFTGGASFIYEISWIRMLSLVLGSTTHSFELMLSAFITGLALGGLWIRKRIDNFESPTKFLGKVQIIMGLMALLTIPVFIQSFDWMANILTALNWKSDEGYELFQVFSHLISMAVMLPATFMAGMTLPLLTHVLVKSGMGEKSIGSVYSANTLGSIGGVIFAMQLGLPLLGIKLLVVFAALLDIGLGVFLLYRLIEGRVRLGELVLVGTTLAVVIIVGVFGKVDASLLVSGVYRYGAASLQVDRNMLYYRDGKTSSVGFYLTAAGDGVITTNGKPDASIVMDPERTPRTEDEVTMVMAGTLPFAFRPDARSIANIGLGSGLTTHAILADGSVSRVDTIEIEESMVLGSRYFGGLVDRAHSDPRSFIHIDDAKSFFAVNNSVYDIIIAEPSNPWVSGVSSLFSREFYDTVRNYLDNDGLFVQWIQLYEFDDMLLLSILSALGESFDDYAIFNTDSSNALIVSKKSGSLGLPNWERLFDSEFGGELVRQQIESPDDLLIRRLADKRLIESMLASYPVVANSDYFPFVDLNAAKARFTLSSSQMLQNWAEAPLPLIEMLEGFSIDISKVTRSNFLTKSHRVSRAKAVLALMQGDTADQEGEYLEDLLIQSLTMLKLVADGCTFIDNAAAWNNAVFGTFISTVPFLSSQDGVKLLSRISGSNCTTNSRSMKQNNLLAFYAAIAERDARAMIQSGQSLLSSAAENEGLPADYILSVVLLGYLSQGEYEEARDFVNASFPQWASPEFGQMHYQQLLIGLVRSNTY